MSGPIVRKYGFPNFDRIFGKKELQHGVEDPDATSAAEQIARAAGAETRPAADAQPQGRAQTQTQTQAQTPNNPADAPKP